MTADIFLKLREQLDQYSIGFPTTTSGVELEILKRLFDEEEAELFLHLSLALETPQSLAERIGRAPEGVGDLLHRMAEKGLIFRLRGGTGPKYAAVPFVVGSFEFQLKTMDRELARLVDQYMREGLYRNFKGVTSFLRPIPVNRSVSVTHPVARYEDARQILSKQKEIALADCICRVQHGLLEQACDRPVEVCFSFGSHARYYTDKGMARFISVEEAFEVLDRSEAAGLVTQPFNTQNPGGMCNCCSDCCGVLRGLRVHPRPAEMVLSNYFASIEAEACVGCETCLERCQMDALSMNDDGVAEVNLDRCIGCGLCVTTCPAEALRLEIKSEEARRIPPENGRQQMTEMAMARGKSLIPLSMGSR